MKIFMIVLMILFVLLLVFYVFVSIRINVLTKQRKEEMLNSLNEKERDIIRRYIESCQVSMKDVFVRRK